MKYRSVLSLAIVLFCAAARGQTAAEQSPAPETKYTLAGTVVNATTGEPVSRALVQIFSGSQQATLTDAGGRFEFTNLPPGPTGLSARKPGFLSPEEIDPQSQPAPAVTVGPGAAAVILKLVPLGVISGHVQKSDGDPIRNLSVQVLYFHIGEGRKQWDLINTSLTNEDGEFRFANLKPGRYYIAAGPSSHAAWLGSPGSRAREGGYRLVFYPGVTDLAASTPIDISPGQQAQADLSLTPEPIYRVAGTVTGLSAEQTWAQVQISPRGLNLGSMPLNQNPDGSFETKLPAGSYMVGATVYTAERPAQAELPIDVHSDLTGLNLIISEGPNLPVEVAVEATRPVAVRQGRNMALSRVNLMLRPQPLKPGRPDYGFSVGNDKQAEHSIRAVESGTYSLEFVPANPELYVDSAQCGGADLLRENLVIGPGTTTPIRIVLRDDGGRLTGSVVSGGRGAHGTVLIIPDRAPRQVVTVPAGPGGQFQSGKLAPGEYTLLAFDRIAGIEYTNAEVLQPFLSYATHASVTANGETRVSVNVIQAGK